MSNSIRTKSPSAITGWSSALRIPVQSGTLLPDESGEGSVLALNFDRQCRIKIGNQGDVEAIWDEVYEVSTGACDTDAERAEEFAKDVYHFSMRGEADDGIDCVIAYFDWALRSENLRACELALLRTAPEVLDEAIALAFLSMTFAERDRLAAHRNKFFERLRLSLAARHAPNEVAQLLYGL